MRAPRLCACVALVTVGLPASACGLVDALAGGGGSPIGDDEDHGGGEGEGGEGEGEGEGEGDGEGEGEAECESGALLEARSVAVGFDRSCAVLCDGALRCWGAQTGEPPTGPFVEAAVSSSFACGRTEEGDVRCFGRLVDLDPPELDGAPIAMMRIAAGQDFLCGLTSAGALHCWGELNWPSFDAPAGAFASLAVGWGYVCAHRLDNGALICGGTDFTPEPPSTPALHDVDVGSYFGCGLDDAGALVCFDDEALVDLVIPPGSFTALGVGDGTACAVRSDDAALVCFGNHIDSDALIAATPAGRYRSVDVASSHACAVREDYAVVCFGDDDWGRTAVPAP